MTKKAAIFDCYDDYNIRLKYVKEVLINKGYDVTVYLSDFDHFTKKTVQNKRTDCEYIPVLPYTKNLSYARIHSHMNFANKCKKILENNSYDLVYAIIPPNSLAHALGKYKEKHKSCKLYFDICDMWPETFPVQGLKGLLTCPFSIWRNYRDKSLKYADHVFAECELFNELLENNTKANNISTLYLCKKQLITEYINKPMDALSFVYLGSINNIIDIDVIVNLLTEVKKYKDVLIHIIGDGEQREKFIQALQDHSIETVYHGRIFDDHEKMKIMEKCHFGLNVMKDSVCVGLTMKSLDYFSYALPIVNNIKGDTWNFVESNMIGMNIQDISSVATITASIDQDTYKSLVENTIQLHAVEFTEEAILNHLSNFIS